MSHLDEVVNAIMEALNAYPRISGLILGIAAHPIVSALLR